MELPLARAFQTLVRSPEVSHVVGCASTWPLDGFAYSLRRSTVVAPPIAAEFRLSDDSVGVAVVNSASSGSKIAPVESSKRAVANESGSWRVIRDCDVKVAVLATDDEPATFTTVPLGIVLPLK